MPGSRLPICPREKLMEEKPDIVLILPWNWADEIARQISFVKEYGGELVTLIPELKKISQCIPLYPLNVLIEILINLHAI